MANKRKNPGEYTVFKGLFDRGSKDSCPADHFADCLNLSFAADGNVQTREGMSQFSATTNIVRTALYKPNPPFSGSNIPRMIYLKSDGSLYDINYPTTPLATIGAMKDFGFVNFFGRCYISPSDGKVGLQNEKVYVYDGTGPSGFRPAAGTAPVSAMTANLHIPLGGGNLAVGTYLFSYAFETSSGFITAPAPFVAIDSFGSDYVDVTLLPTGPSYIVARWIIACKAIPLRADLSIPFDVSTADLFPQYLWTRIGDNTTTTTTISFYDEQLINSADDLFTRLPVIPAGVGLVDYKGRMVPYGEYSNPSIVRASKPGEPESFNSTSGFFITDPSDSTGVRCATEFRNTLYAFKQQRGYMVQDNGDEASTWDVVNFEKAVGTEQYGIAAVLDAKGSTSEGYLIADRGGIIFFNGTMQEPELTYKIRDFWKRVNYTHFYTMQMAVDYINKRIYALIPLDDAITPSHILVGDFRDGLDPGNIKWCPWRIDPQAPTSILIYNDFSGGEPILVTRLANLTNIMTLNSYGALGGNDVGTKIEQYFELAPLRYTPYGITTYNKAIFRIAGKATLVCTAYSMDKTYSFNLRPLILNSDLPGREFAIPMNLVSEQLRLKVYCNVISEYFLLNAITVLGMPTWGERPS